MSIRWFHSPRRHIFRLAAPWAEGNSCPRKRRAVVEHVEQRAEPHAVGIGWSPNPTYDFPEVKVIDHHAPFGPAIQSGQCGSRARWFWLILSKPEGDEFAGQERRLRMLRNIQHPVVYSGNRSAIKPSCVMAGTPAAKAFLVKYLPL